MAKEKSSSKTDLPNWDTLLSQEKILDSLPVPSFLINIQKNVCFANRRFRSWAEIRSSALSNSPPITDLLTFDDVTAHPFTDDEITIKKRTTFRDISCHNPNGERGLFEITLQPLQQDNQVAGYLCTLLDMLLEENLQKKYARTLQELKDINADLEEAVAQRTKELSASQRDMREILDTINQSIFTIDSNKQIGSEVSKESSSIFQTNIANKKIDSILYPKESQHEERKELVTAFNIAFEDSHDMFIDWDDIILMLPSEINLSTSDEKEKIISFLYTPIRDEKDHIIKIMVMASDITDARALEAAFTQKEAQVHILMAALDADPNEFKGFIKESEKRLSEINEMIQDISLGHFDAEPIDALFRVMHTIKGNARNYNIKPIEDEFHAAEQYLDTIRENKEPIESQQIEEMKKSLARAQEIFKDVTELAQKIIPDLDGTAATDKKEDEEIAVSSELIDDIQKLIKTLPGNKSEILNRLKEVKMKSLSGLFTRLERMTQDIAQSQGKQIKPLEITGRDTTIVSSKFNAVGDCLVHLVRNCLGHGIEAPETRSKNDKVEEGQITICAEVKSQGRFTRLVISDDGAGIDASLISQKAIDKGLVTKEDIQGWSENKIRELVFAPGFSTKEEADDISGRGVGLDFVKKTIADLGGQISIDSTPGQGTSFTIDLARSSFNILIVDDEAINQKVVEKMLSSYGRCRLAGNGKEALDMFQSAHEEGDPYHLICLDILMPEMDGWEVMEKIRSFEKEQNVGSENSAKIIVISGIGYDEAANRAFKFGSQGYISKPINKDQLIETMKDLDLLI